ncbi:MAG: preQ(1) synthase [Deltaproteobacteria bacterium]|nr:preQ(1) synthase [Deltaproteobacteria bacterium]
MAEKRGRPRKAGGSKVARRKIIPYGTRMIAEASLETVPNNSLQRDYEVSFTIAEFTCVCPRSGFPDFATIRIRYVPDRRLIELRSLKLYINGYRDVAIFHEAVVNTILDDFVAAADPKWVEIIGDFNVRGNIKTVVTATHTKRRTAGVQRKSLKRRGK